MGICPHSRSGLALVLCDSPSHQIHQIRGGGLSDSLTWEPQTSLWAKGSALRHVPHHPERPAQERGGELRDNGAEGTAGEDSDAPSVRGNYTWWPLPAAGFPLSRGRGSESQGGAGRGGPAPRGEFLLPAPTAISPGGWEILVPRPGSSPPRGHKSPTDIKTVATACSPGTPFSDTEAGTAHTGGSHWPSRPWDHKAVIRGENREKCI